MSRSFVSMATDMPRQYRYKYRAELFAGTWKHIYSLIGMRGAVSLHVSGPHVYDGRDNWSAGLEFHYRQPPDYMGDQPPSHDHCWLMQCPCWHDGTSLYAQEEYLPLVLGGMHEDVFRGMARDANAKFSRKCDGGDA